MKNFVILLFLGILFGQAEAQNLLDFKRFDETTQATLLSVPAAPGGDESALLPPPGPMRSMAEWEELQAVCISYISSYDAILKSIVTALYKQVPVIILVKDQGTLNNLKNYFITVLKEDSPNIKFLVGSYNSVWIRDYGPNSAYLNEVDSLAIVDWIYNRPSRPLDDKVPTLIGNSMGIPVYQTNTSPTDLVHTGGNFMSDGAGRAFSSKLVLAENASGNPYGVSTKSESQIKSILKSYMGIQDYVLMNTLPYDGIHHIDMHMKLLDERTLLVGKYPEGVADGPQIEANIQYVLSQFKAPDGLPYEVVRVAMPPDFFGDYPDSGGDYRTYANSLIANGAIIVPTYEEQYDTSALRIWRQTMPGYTVTGINCNAIIPALGALHCITKEVGVSDPLLIQHVRMRDQKDAKPDGYTLSAYIRHKSGIQSATCWYSTDTLSGYQPLDMTALGDTTGIYEAVLPNIPGAKRYYYYLEAEAASGKSIRRPWVAPKGYFTFTVENTVTSTPEAEMFEFKPVFPNPASALTAIPLVMEHPAPVRISLMDLNGRTLRVIHDGPVDAGSRYFFFQANEFTPGCYLVKLESGSQVMLQKVIVF